MLLPIHLILISFGFKNILTEDILLPTFVMNNQSLSTTSTSFYLCHLHQLKNSEDFFLQGYNIINGETAGHVHHLLLYECSIKDSFIYSGLCGIYNARLMPLSVYRHCQTRIIIAWAQGGQLKYDYPINTGLKMTSYTQLLLEVHFEPSIPYNQTIGIHLRFYPIDKKPRYEIGVLTLGTLAVSPIYLPPRLNTIRFPTYCFNDCLKSHLRNNLVINIFSILLHAHRHATRIILATNDFNQLFDQNPFKFHKQENIYFKKPYPQINSTNELSLTCYYSTRDEYSNAIYGGHDSNNEMCQAFLYYYPKIEAFPLCLSLPVYKNKNLINEKQNWTDKLSLYIKYELESNLRHLSICGDNIDFNNSNQSIIQTKIYQRSIQNIQPYYYYTNIPVASIFYSIMMFFFLISILYGYMLAKKQPAFFY